MDFSNRLRAELKEQGLTVYRLARLLEPENPWRAERNLYFWLAGTKEPSRVSRERVARALGRSPDFFGKGSTYPRKRRLERLLAEMNDLLNHNREMERVA